MRDIGKQQVVVRRNQVEDHSNEGREPHQHPQDFRGDDAAH
jgi:hypothetical protein